MQKRDVDTITVLHYGNKIIEYCNQYEDCINCPLYDSYNNCHFAGKPCDWTGVDVHE